MTKEFGRALEDPPRSPRECTFARMSANYSADLCTHVDPCIFGGNPDCANCGCAVSAGFHGASQVGVAGPLKVAHLVNASVKIGAWVNRLRPQPAEPARQQGPPLTQIRLSS